MFLFFSAVIIGENGFIESLAVFLSWCVSGKKKYASIVFTTDSIPTIIKGNF
jgi:hypothetical protein